MPARAPPSAPKRVVAPALQIVIDAKRRTTLFPLPYVVIWPAGLQPR